MYICIYIYTHTHTHTHTYTRTSARAHTHAHTHTHNMHACTRTSARAHTHTHTHTMLQKKAQLKPANGARKKQAQNVRGRCRAPEPASQRRHILPGAVFRASLRCLLLLSCYAASIVGLAPAVKTGFATLALPSMQAASSETLTPATPRLELALTGSPCVASSPESLHHALAPNFPSPDTSRVPKVLCFYIELSAFLSLSLSLSLTHTYIKCLKV